MKTSVRTLLLSLFLVIGVGFGSFSYAADAPAEVAPPAGMKLIPEDLVADLNVSAYSQYIWRGYALSKDSFVIMPTLTIGYKGFAVNVWTDLDTHFKGTSNKDFRLQETDVTVSYSNSFAPLKLNYSLGWILYDYQPTSGDVAVQHDTKNQEIYLTLGLDLLLKPTLSYYQEIEKGYACYLQFGVAHSFAVYKDWSLDLGATISYMNNKSLGSKGTNFSDLHDGSISAGLKIPINKYLSVKPNIQYSFPLSSAASREIKANSLTNRGFTGNGDSNYVYGGLIFDLAI
ncbi:MAG: hypothetical protein HXX11_16320 [Desulfuromonadales bacterium]|nr:hypothetical protein [Desulfuromonadales bacterium]